MKQHLKLTLALCGIWMATLLYGEMFAFWVPSLWACSWPHLLHHPSSANFMMHGVTSPSDYINVAVLADPQLMDSTSHHLPPKSRILEIAQFYNDLYMRRAYHASILPFKPDVILFLGDYFDGGPYVSDEEWQESAYRFKHIFGLNVEERYSDIQFYFIPGNHDIGYASINSQKPEIVRRYGEQFGTRNYRFTVGKLEFIAVDAQTLDGHPEGNLTMKTWEFVKNVSKDVQLMPRVLLTHIPLYRRDHTYCGPYRNSPVINQRISRSTHNQEIVYQNYVTEESSNHLLELIKPVVILSGHDHDQCTVTHESKFGSVVEHTVGTVSWQQGNLYPSFMLLSASNSKNASASAPEEALRTQLCFLPIQTCIYIWYILLFALTFLTPLLWPTSGTSFGRHFSNLMACVRVYGSMFSGGSKEKIEDDDCEYEMMWDAEGSMHLVKKQRETTPISCPNDIASVERGNAVMRPTAKKHVSKEIEVSMNIDTNVGFDPIIKLPHKTGKSKTKIIINKIVRTFRMLTIIAAVNMPLYVMLLFKDWVDQ